MQYSPRWQPISTEFRDRSENYRFLGQENGWVKPQTPPKYLATSLGRKLKKRGLTLTDILVKIRKKYPHLSITKSDISNFLHNRKKHIGEKKRTSIKNYFIMIHLIPKPPKPKMRKRCRCPKCGARHIKKK